MIQSKSIQAALTQDVVLITNCALKQDVYQMLYEHHGKEEMRILIVNPGSVRFRSRDGLARYISAQTKHQKMVYIVESEMYEYSRKESISFAQEHGEFFAIISENVQDTEWINMHCKVMGAPPTCNIRELDAMLIGKQLTGATG